MKRKLIAVSALACALAFGSAICSYAVPQAQSAGQEQGFMREDPEGKAPAGCEDDKSQSEAKEGNFLDRVRESISGLLGRDKEGAPESKEQSSDKQLKEAASEAKEHSPEGSREEIKSEDKSGSQSRPEAQDKGGKMPEGQNSGGNSAAGRGGRPGAGEAQNSGARMEGAGGENGLKPGAR